MNITLGNRIVGAATRPVIIAEVSGNHNGDINIAKAIINEAARAGADVVKLQTYRPDTMTIKSDNPDFQIKGDLWSGKSLWDLYEWAHTPYEWHQELFDHSASLGITCISTPFDESALELLERLDCPFYKIASFEITDLPLIKVVAKTRKPMIISTGMADAEEIKRALEIVRKYGASDAVLLHCVSGYPTPTEAMNLTTIVTLKREMGCHIGLSDHSLDSTAAIAAVALGAKVIEKHLTLRRSDGGPDAAFSLEPNEFAELVRSVHACHDALGDGVLGIQQHERPNLRFRRSIYAVEPIKVGDKFTLNNVKRIRPGYGLSPLHYDALLRKRAKRNIATGERIVVDDLNDE
jgi:N-acetylneuraminate synthase